jgi:hypothetical protein
MNRSAARTPATLLLGVLLAAPLGAAGSAATAVCASSLEQQVLGLVNAERAALGRPALLLDVRLTAAARRHVDDMRAGCFLSHTGSDGSSASARMAETGYAGGLGEVAAAGSWPYPPQQVVSSWMASPGHRNILMNTNARHLGIAYADYAPGCLLQGYAFYAGGFWVGTSGDGADSELLDSSCCAAPGGEPVCVPEPASTASGAAALLALTMGRRIRAHAE